MKGPRGECPLLLPVTVQGQAGPWDRTALATGRDVQEGLRGLPQVQGRGHPGLRAGWGRPWRSGCPVSQGRGEGTRGNRIVLSSFPFHL